MHHSPRLLTAAAAVAALVLPLSFSPAPSASAAPAASARQVKTPFLMAASGFGTKVVGAQVPADSTRTGYEIIGCQKLAGRSKVNAINNTTVPGLGQVQGIRTRVWTEKKGNRVASRSLHSIARIALLDTPLGSLDLVGLRSTATAFNKGGKYGANGATSLARIVLTPPVGDPVTLPIPSPGRTLTVPGLAAITLGRVAKDVSPQGSSARATALRIRVIPTGTTVVVGQTTSRIDDAVKRGFFSGSAVGLEARALADNVTIGRQAYQPLGCVGTDGANESAETAGVDIDGVINTGNIAGAVRSTLNRQRARAVTAGRVVDASLFGGQIKIGLVTGVADVTRIRKNNRLVRSTAGSRVAELEVGGEVINLDRLGDFEIPGLAKLESKIVERSRNGMRTIGLRVTVLDGTGATIDLGVAEAKVRPSRKK